MKCVHLIPTKEHGLVPCGKCYACLAKRRSDWFVRLFAEFVNSSTCVFFTLTYDNDNLPESNSVVRSDITNFVRRVRRSLEYKEKGSGKELRYFIVSEYGDTTYRPHYHGFFFNINPLFEKLDNYQSFISKHWDKGFVSTGKPSAARFNYVCKYVIKPKPVCEHLAKPFLVCNRRPAIGLSLLTDEFKKYIKDNLKTVIKFHCYTRSLPRYYRDKIFDEHDKERLKEQRELQVQEEARKRWEKDVELTNKYNDPLYFQRLEREYALAKENQYHKRVTNKKSKI